MQACKSCFLSSCQYTHCDMHWLSWPHDTLACVLVLIYALANSTITSTEHHSANILTLYYKHCTDFTYWHMKGIADTQASFSLHPPLSSILESTPVPYGDSATLLSVNNKSAPLY